MQMEELVKKFLDLHKNQLAKSILQFFNTLYAYPEKFELSMNCEHFLEDVELYEI